MTMFQTKLSLSAFNPKLMLGKLYPDGAPPMPELLLGNIIGIANGIKKGTAADGVTPTQGLMGNFEVEFIEQKGKDGKTLENVASGVAYLPEAFMDPIIHLLAGEVNAQGEVIKDPVSSVQFAYGVYIIPANNPAKYSWQLRPLLDASANDPLAAMKSQLKALPAPTPEPEAVKGKK